MAPSAGLHEPEDRLSPAPIDRRRALVSVQQELETIDWHDQRVDATTDPEGRRRSGTQLRRGKEHAAMTLEWLRRQDPVLDRHLRTYPFTTEPVVEEEAAVSAAPHDDGSLGIGDLRDGRS
jgi:hypothetical protein